MPQATGSCWALLDQVGQMLEKSVPASLPLLALGLRGPFLRAALEEG